MTGFPTVLVELALGYPPLSASPVWTDITAKVLQSEGVSRTYGRTDPYSGAQPGTLSLTLDNTDGRFTAGLTTGAYYPNIRPGVPIRVSHTFNGVLRRRFYGNVNEWPTAWPGGGQTYSQVQITATDSSRRLNRGRKLRSMLAEEILYDSPVAYWPLGEPDGSVSAGDIAGTATNLTIGQAGGGNGTLTFGQGTGPRFDGLPAVVTAPGGPEEGKFLRAGTIAGAVGGGVCTVEAWVNATAGAADGSVVVSAIFGDRRSYLQVYFNGSGQLVGRVLGFQSADVAVAATATSASVYANSQTHHVVAVGTIAASSVTVSLYVDGALRGTQTTGGSGLTVPTVINDLGVAGTPARAGYPPLGLHAATFAHAAVYGFALSAARVLVHYQAGATGFAGEKTDVRVRRLARYAGIADLPAGVLTNLGFEVDAAGWGILGGTFIRDTAVKYEGTASGKITWNATAAARQAYLTQTATGLTVGRQYRASAWVRSAATGPPVVIEAWPSGAPDVYGQTCAADDVWRQISVTFTATATTAGISFLNGAANTAGKQAWIDAVIPPTPVPGLLLDAGASGVAGVDTTGQTAVTAMADVATAEDGLLFFDGAGALVLQSRTRRFNQASTFTLTAGTLQEVGADTSFTTDDAEQVNDATYVREGGGPQRAFNAASIATDGTYTDEQTLLLSTDNEVLDRANWTVQTRNTPAPRCPSITVDLLTQPSATLVAGVLDAQLSARLTVAGLPSQAPSASVALIVEGETERLSDSEWSVTWNTSRASTLTNVWTFDTVTTEPLTFAY